MPKSRGRRPRHTHASGARPRASRGLGPSRFSVEERAWAARNLQIIQRLDATEARGDVAAALVLLNEDVARRPASELFWRPDRVRHLMQLALFEPVLSAWVYSRWILEQAVRWLDTSRRERERRAFDRTVRIIGGLEWYGHDDVDASVKLRDHDWAYRQLMLYEYGALQHFLDKVAATSLIAKSDQVRDWSRASMGGYRLHGRPARALLWKDLETGQLVEVPDVGSASLVEVGEHVIGRLVPTISGPMFESAPLVVPADVALDVSHDPYGWMSALEQGCRRAAASLETISTYCTEFPLLCDVPPTLQHLVAHQVARADGDARSGAWGDDGVAGCVAVIRAALGDGFHVEGFPEPWSIVGAMLLDPSVFEACADAPADPAALHRLAERLVTPAADVCRVLAARPDAVA